jgi:hypothetical protein
MMQGLVIPLEGSIAGWIVSQGKPIVLVDAAGITCSARG